MHLVLAGLQQRVSSDLGRQRVVWGDRLAVDGVLVLGWPTAVPYPAKSLKTLEIPDLLHVGEALKRNAISFVRTGGMILCFVCIFVCCIYFFYTLNSR